MLKSGFFLFLGLVFSLHAVGACEKSCEAKPARPVQQPKVSHEVQVPEQFLKQLQHEKKREFKSSVYINSNSGMAR